MTLIGITERSRQFGQRHSAVSEKLFGPFHPQRLYIVIRAHVEFLLEHCVQRDWIDLQVFSKIANSNASLKAIQDKLVELFLIDRS